MVRVLRHRLRARPASRPGRVGARSTAASSIRAGTSCGRRRWRARKKLGVVPEDTVLTPRPRRVPGMGPPGRTRRSSMRARWRCMRASRRTRTITSAACFDAIDEMGELDDTLVIYIFGDNGSEPRGHRQPVSFNEMTVMANGILQADAPTSSSPVIVTSTAGLDRLGLDGGLRAPLRGGVGLGRQHAVPVGQAGGLASRRHAGDGHGQAVAVRGSRTAGGQRIAVHALASTSGADQTWRWRTSRRPGVYFDGVEAGAAARHQLRLHVRRAPTPGRATHSPSTSRPYGNRATTRTAGWASAPSSTVVPWDVDEGDARQALLPGAYDPEQ